MPADRVSCSMFGGQTRQPSRRQRPKLMEQSVTEKKSHFIPRNHENPRAEAAAAYVPFILFIRPYLCYVCIGRDIKNAKNIVNVCLPLCVYLQRNNQLFNTFFSLLFWRRRGGRISFFFHFFSALFIFFALL